MSFVGTFGDAQDLNFGNTYTSPTVTLGTGFFIVGLIANQTYSSVTIAGVTAAQLAAHSNGNMFLYGASISAATGTVVAVSPGALVAMSVSGGLLSSYNTTVVNTYQGTGGVQFDPQQLTGVIPSGGIGVLLGGNYQSGNNQTLSWSNATAETATNADINGTGPTGTSATSGMASCVTSGIQIIGVSGGASALDFSGGILMATFNAAVGDVLAAQILL